MFYFSDDVWPDQIHLEDGRVLNFECGLKLSSGSMLEEDKKNFNDIIIDLRETHTEGDVNFFKSDSVRKLVSDFFNIKIKSKKTKEKIVLNSGDGLIVVIPTFKISKDMTYEEILNAGFVIGYIDVD